VVATATGVDEVVQLHAGTLQIASQHTRPGDHVRLRARDAEVIGAGTYEVEVSGEALARVYVRAGSAEIRVVGQQTVLLSTGQTWRASVITTDVSPGQPDTQVAVAPKPDADRDPGAAPDSDPHIAQPDIDRDPNAIPKPGTQVAPKPDTQAAVAPKPDTNRDPLAVSKPDARIATPAPGTNRDPVAVPKPDAKRGPVAVPKPDANRDPLAVPKPDTNRDPLAVPKPDANRDPLAVPKSDVRTSVPKPDTNRDPVAVPKPDTRTDPKSATRASQKADVRTDSADPTVKPADPPKRTGPSAIEKRFQHGWALLKQNKAREAAFELGAAADTDPNDPLAADARYLQAVALVKAGERSEAERVLVKFLDHAPKSLRRGRAAVLLGRLLGDRGDIVSARAWLESAVADPDPNIVAAAKAGLQALEPRR
jgi:hypothetical protein